MIKVLIVEDEHHAMQHLENLLLKIDNTIVVQNRFDSIKKSAEWLNSNPHPDLIFMDIQLADGLSFEIFELADINVPVIFTTAYNEYALKAFKVNSIDYLLKPIDGDELAKSLEKFKKLNQKPEIYDKKIFDKIVHYFGNQYKNRFLVKIGTHIKTIPTSDVCYFYSMEKLTFLQSNQNISYPLDYSLDETESLVDPQSFFRINRKYIIAIDSIIDINAFSNSRLKIKLKNCSDDEVIVSREKVNDFKNWIS